MQHIPVLLEETTHYLINKKNGKYFDGTVGFGGHSEAILKHLGNNSILICSDKDINAFQFCKKKFEDDNRVKLYNTSFTNIYTISKIEFVDFFDGIMADLGVSSFQLDDVKSGFTYRNEAELDLRMDKSNGAPASDFLNENDEKEISKILYEYGEERNSRKIAKKIIEWRSKKKIQTTTDLKDIIEQITPERFLNKTLSRVFQALRIHVNNELEELKAFLTKSVDLLNAGGRLAVISFHSLEDRIIKEHFKYEASDCICPPDMPICQCDKKSRLKILTKKPIVPSEIEVSKNKRARSAKLRAAERI